MRWNIQVIKLPSGGKAPDAHLTRLIGTRNGPSTSTPSHLPDGRRTSDRRCFLGFMVGFFYLRKTLAVQHARRTSGYRTGVWGIKESKLLVQLSRLPSALLETASTLASHSCLCAMHVSRISLELAFRNFFQRLATRHQGLNPLSIDDDMERGNEKLLKLLAEETADMH
ncbi:hypothetical protein BKA80DRAFT_38421 [Phyllosticta citrichinensis]